MDYTGSINHRLWKIFFDILMIAHNYQVTMGGGEGKLLITTKI